MIPLFESVLSFTDLRAFLAIALKHKRLMVLCVCLGIALGLTYITYKQPVYYSKSLIHVVSSVPLPVDAEVVFRDSTLGSVKAQLLAPHMERRTARRLGLKVSLANGVDKYIRKTSVNFNSEGDIVFEIWAYSNRIAAEWSEALVAEYLAYREEKRFERREKIVRSFTSEMERVRRKIEEFERAKDSFLEQEQVDDIKRTLNELSSAPSRLMIVNNKLSFMNTVKHELETRNKTVTELLALLSSVRQRINDIQIGSIVHIMNTEPANQKKPGNVVVTPEVLAEGNRWMALEKQQRRLLMELKEAGEIYLPAHKKIIELQEELAETNKELEFELETAERRFNLEYAALVNEKESLEKQYNELQELTKRDAALQRAFSQITAGRLSWETMYANMSRELEKIDFGADSERLELQYMGLVDYRDYPISPYRRKIMLFAFALGLGLAVAVPFLLEYLDDTITFDEQVERELNLKTIGIIPAASPGEREDKADLNLLSGDSNHRLKEYFRVIRVNLMSNIEFSGNRQVFMVASALPKEGKSVVALNLAASFANLGEKTLLIDADLRRGVIHRIFQVPSRPGLGQALRGEITLDKAVIQTMEKNLLFMPCGRRHIHSASELLESAVFEKILASLKEQYDKIIIDTPPVLGLAETSSIAKLADGVVMVIWSGNTAKKAVKTAVTTLLANGAKFFGCILNKLDLTSATSYYYYYYYSYKYYKAYSHNPEDEQKSNNTPENGSSDEV